MGDGELLLYSKALEQFPDSAIASVVHRLSVTPRGEYEPKIPELPDLIAMVQSEARKANPWVPCGNCGDGGHVIEQRDGRNYAVRCECWKAWKERQ